MLVNGSHVSSPILFGAHGFVGKAIAKGLPVVAVGSEEVDLADRESCMRFAVQQVHGAVWVLAAARSPDAPGDPTENMLANIAMAQHWVEMAHVAKPSALLFLSSVDVYGRRRCTMPLHESSPLLPETPYAVSKLVSEAVLTRGSVALGIPCGVFRLPGVYGPEDRHGGPVHRFTEAALSGESITVQGDGEQQRDLVFVDDVVALVQAWCVAPRAGLWNVVTGASVSLNRMLQALEAAHGAPLKVVRQPAEQLDLRFHPSTIWDELHVSPTPIESGLAETYTRMRGSRVA